MALAFPSVSSAALSGNTWMSLPASVFRRFGHLGRLPGIAGLRLLLDGGLALYFPAFLFSGPPAQANATGVWSTFLILGPQKALVPGAAQTFWTSLPYLTVVPALGPKKPGCLGLLPLPMWLIDWFFSFKGN
jgi:hypothetical protein